MDIFLRRWRRATKIRIYGYILAKFQISANNLRFKFTTSHFYVFGFLGKDAPQKKRGERASAFASDYAAFLYFRHARCACAARLLIGDIVSKLIPDADPAAVDTGLGVSCFSNCAFCESMRAGGLDRWSMRPPRRRSASWAAAPGGRRVRVWPPLLTRG